jgi:hypothetical protein
MPTALTFHIDDRSQLTAKPIAKKSRIILKAFQEGVSSLSFDGELDFLCTVY